MKLLYYTITGWKELNNKNMHKTSFVFKMILLNSYLFTAFVSFRMLGLVKACIHASLFTDWEKKMSFPRFSVASQLIGFE